MRHTPLLNAVTYDFWVGIVSFFNEYAHRHMFSGQMLILKLRIVRAGSVDIRHERWFAR